MDEALLSACARMPPKVLARTNEDKEKAVCALLEPERWRRISDGEIANAAGVERSYVLKFRKWSLKM